MSHTEESPDPHAPPAPSWDEAAAATARWLRRQGYPDARPGEEGGDVGVRASGALALVHGPGAVRRSQLERLLHARGRNAEIALYAVTSGRFELPAVTYADAKRILLLSYDGEGGVTRYDHEVALVTSGKAGDPAGSLPVATSAILQHLPLLFGLFMYVAAAIQLVGLLRGAPGASWGGAAISLVLGAAFTLAWVVGRRQRARRRGAGASPTRRDRST